LVGLLAILSSFSPLQSTLYLGKIAAFISGFIAVFQVLPRWNGLSRLSLRQEKSGSQNNKYLITIQPKFMTYNNINNNNKSNRDSDHEYTFATTAKL
jgi:hypothetical protein